MAYSGQTAVGQPESPEVHGHDAGHPGGHHGHDDHAAQFRSKFWWTLILAIPVVGFSPMFAGWFGYTLPGFTGSAWIAPVIGTIIFIYGGWPFLSGAWSEIRPWRPGMMLLISLAISVAFVASWATTLGIGGFDLDFWWELALLVVIMLLGHWIEMRALGATSGALDALAALLPDSADLVDSDTVREVPLAELAVDDVVLVRPGARVPADGEIVDGAADVDESTITGESRPVRHSVGDSVVAGTTVADSALRVRVRAIGEETTLAGIRRLVAEAQSSSSRAQALADRAAAWLFYFATIAAVITFATWLLLGSPNDAISRTVTVLVIACPHALGLAIPLVIAISTERSARAGVLIKDRAALERMRTTDVVLFDKTGTLTTGSPVVTSFAAVDHEHSTDVASWAAAAEASSEHPLARAIIDYAHAIPGGHEYRAADFRSVTGRGVQARVAGRNVVVGGPGVLNAFEVDVAPEISDDVNGWIDEGATILYVLVDRRMAGAFALQDDVRPESRAAVDALHHAGVSVGLITGDARQVADTVANTLGIDEVFAEVMPQDKDGKVVELQQRGLKVTMVGDGVNDAPALARADIGIAIGAGTDIAMESAGVVLASNDPRAVLSVIELSKRSYRKMWQNLAWATGYNLFAVPLAAGVLAGVGFVLSPAVGAVLMSLSTIVVALNAQMLRRIDLDPANTAVTRAEDSHPAEQPVTALSR